MIRRVSVFFAMKFGEVVNAKVKYGVANSLANFIASKDGAYD